METLMHLGKVITADGSTSVYHEQFDENYHSVHGALQESLHVFIEAGLREFRDKTSVSVFEMGFGTGLNALLTALEASGCNQRISYTAIEKYPLTDSVYDQMNFCDQIHHPACKPFYTSIVHAEWNKPVQISQEFSLVKLSGDLSDLNYASAFDVIYFDAFAPSAQPELWSQQVFSSMYEALKPGGVLVTYCAKGEVKRNMKAAGFSVESLPGPKGKREMTRARKV
jgi:tRNA U34 5-methylaminomethyl-2-thiouridine-forming methyltransferase MnmC